MPNKITKPQERPKLKAARKCTKPTTTTASSAAATTNGTNSKVSSKVLPKESTKGLATKDSTKESTKLSTTKVPTPKMAAKEIAKVAIKVATTKVPAKETNKIVPKHFAKETIKGSTKLTPKASMKEAAAKVSATKIPAKELTKGTIKVPVKEFAKLSANVSASKERTAKVIDKDESDDEPIKEEEDDDADDNDDEPSDESSKTLLFNGTTKTIESRPGPSRLFYISDDDESGNEDEENSNSRMKIDQNQNSDPLNPETISFEPSYLHEEQYRLWKKNAQYLYDMLIAHTNEWPSLTVEWLPDVIRPPHRDYAIHRLLIGTQASARSQNHLIISRVHLPHFDMSKLTNKTSLPTKTGYGAFGVITAKVENYIKINHDGHVNRARHMPQNSFIIASKSSNNSVYIFDYSKHQSDPTPNSDSQPDARLVGHTDEGYGLSWNCSQRGLVLSASDDELICLWDINGNQKKGRTVQAKSKFSGHVGPVNDVQWHCFHDKMFASAGDDKKLILWDTRLPSPHSVGTVTAHSAPVNCLSFNPYSEYVMLTGSADKTAALWDLRNLKIKLHSFESHRDEIYQIQWAPHCETVFATCSPDRRLFVWDISKIGQEQSDDEALEGPPELLFIHAGHPSKVTDLSWSPNEPWMMASVSDNNLLQIWKMIHTAYETDSNSNTSNGNRHAC